MLAPSDQPRKFEIFLALASVCFAILFALSDAWVLHPGLAFPDELTQLQWLQEFQEGLSLPFSFGKGCLQRFGMLPAVLGHAGLRGLYLSGQASFVVECLLLYTLGKAWLSERAGLWAVIVCALSSFTFLRLRSLLSYSILPMELLLWLTLLSRARRGPALFLMGLAPLLLVLDYEAWFLGLGVLALAAWQELPQLKFRPLVWGLLAAAALILALSLSQLHTYVAVRGSQSSSGSVLGTAASLLGGLKGYWLGGPAMGNTGVRDQPSFPIWAWVPLLAGLWTLPKARRWWLGWAGLGLLPLLARHSEAEPQRAILAWPALCLIAGSGAAWLSSRRHWAPWALLFLAGAGGLTEAGAYLVSMHVSYIPVYGQSLALVEASQACSSRGAGTVLTEFDNESSAAARFLLPRAQPGGKGLALIPREYCLKENRLKGTWLTVPEHGGACLLEPDKETWERLQKIDAALGPLWRLSPRFDFAARRQGVLDYYLAQPRADVWIKTACLEQIFGSSFMLGQFPFDLLKKVENDKLASASLMLWCAAKLQRQDPAWSARMFKRAALIDPVRTQP